MFSTRRSPVRVRISRAVPSGSSRGPGSQWMPPKMRGDGMRIMPEVMVAAATEPCEKNCNSAMRGSLLNDRKPGPPGVLVTIRTCR